MKKLATVIMMLSLVLGGVALAAAADLPQVAQNFGLKGLQKVSDQEAQKLRGTGMGFSLGGGTGICQNLTCSPNNYNYNYSQYNTTCVPNLYLSPGPHKK